MKTVNHPQAKRQYITAEGLAELRQRLTDLKNTRAKIIGEIRNLALQNNANTMLEDSIGAPNPLAETDAQIALIERAINNATVVYKSKGYTRIQIGSKVTVEAGGTRRTYSIVGSIEADPAKGKVSNESPLGKALIGKKVSDQVEVTRLNRTPLAATVIAIE